jgi:type III secretory pathway component EscV
MSKETKLGDLAFAIDGVPGKIPTCDLSLRRGLLYAAELRGHRRVNA